MSRSFAVGDIIRLRSRSELCFQVVEVIGCGGTCVAYKVSYTEIGGIRRLGILKEYCPAFLGSQSDCRGRSPMLSVSAEHAEAFRDGIDEFTEAYRAINDYLYLHAAAANSHPVMLGLFYGNGTVYSLSACDYGKSYDRVNDSTLKSTLRVIRALALAIAQYHEAGYLHLDIKPQNILILDGVTDLVKLFDYDSLTRLDAVRSRKIRTIPQPGIYYVPELNGMNLRAVGITTDFYEIGALLYLRLFGKAPEPADAESNAVYLWENAPLTAGVSPQAKYELEQLLRNTLQISPRRRYQSDTELLNQIEKVLSLLQEKRPYPLDLPKWEPSAWHLGREAALRELRDHLQRDGYVFLRSMGGIGKSELAKQYARQFGDEYHTVQFCKYAGSLEMLTAAIPMHGLDDTDYDSPASLAEEKRKLLHQCDCHTLIIVDNFNVTYDPGLRDFLPADAGQFHVIFTTRCMPAPAYYASRVMSLPPLSEADCLRLLQLHLAADAVPEEDALALIRRVEHNTLLIQLLAKAMQRAKLSPREMLERLEAQTVGDLREEIFLEYDYTNEETEAYNRLYGHLNTVFSVSGLQSAEKNALKCLTLIPPDGMSEDEFRMHCPDDPTVARQLPMLESLGWISLDAERNITVHQIVSDILAGKAELPATGVYEQLFAGILAQCNIREDIHFSETLRYLSAAAHLNRRCRDVSTEAQLECKLALGILHLNLYQGKNARAILSEANALSRDNGELFLPDILLFQGLTEARFGRQEDAAELFERAIDTGRENPAIWAETVLSAMLRLAAMRADNNENRAALQAFDRAITFATENDMTADAAQIIDHCEDLCIELNNPALLQHYQQLAAKLGVARLTGNEDSVDDTDMDAMAEHLSRGQNAAAQREFARILENCRIVLGESSPLYRDTARWKWLLSALSGEKLQAMRELNEAESFVEQYFGKESVEMAELLAWVGMTFVDLGELSFADEAAERAIGILEKQRSTKQFAYVRATLARASVCLLRGQHSEASKLVDFICLDDYDGASITFLYIRMAGPMLCTMSRYEEVQTLCRKMLSYGDAEPIAHAYARIISASCYEEQGDLDTAEQLVSQVSRDVLGDTDSVLVRDIWLMMYDRFYARLAYRRGDYSEAIRHMDGVIAALSENNSIFLHQLYTERGLFYAENGMPERAEADYRRAEAFLNELQLPGSAYQNLYCNASVLYLNWNKPDQAKQYLDKLGQDCPQVFHPKTLLNALSCHNIGWSSVLSENLETGRTLLDRAVRCMERLGATNSLEYWTARRNQGLLALKEKKNEEAIRIYRAVISGLKGCSCGIQTQLRLRTAEDLCIVLYRAGRQDDARAHITDSLEWFTELYGRDSQMYMELLLRLIEQANAARDRDCAKQLLDGSEELITGWSGTLFEARWNNLLGVWYCDMDLNYNSARFRFRRTLDILEALGQTDDEFYGIVQANLNYVKKFVNT